MKSLKHYFIISAISLLPLLPAIFTVDLPHTHDGLVHLSRIAAYYTELSRLQIPPRWATDLNYGYGLPLFNFIYPLPYLLASAFVALGLSLVFAFKAVLISSYLLSGIFIFSFAREFFRDTRKAWAVTIFYQFAPFRLVELWVRGSFGECLTYAFLPLTLWALARLFKKITVSNLVLTALSLMLVILSHNSVSLVFFAIIALFVIFFSPNRRTLLYSSVALGLGLMASAFYWLPALLEHKYTYGNLLMRDLFRTHFPPLINFFLPNFFNSSKLQTGGVASQFGLFQVIALGLGIYVFFRKATEKKLKRIILFAFGLSIIALLLMQPVSLCLWEKFSLLRQFQFPWRLLSVIVLTTSLSSVSYLELRIFRKPLAYLVLLILVVLTTMYYWFPPLGFDRIRNESIYWNYPLNTTYFGETDVIWSAGPAKAYPQERVEVSEGMAKISNFSQKGSDLSLTVEAAKPSWVVANLQYFPGWRVYIDGAKTAIEFQNPNWRGLITFPVPSGTHQVKLTFGETPLRLIADIVSLATFISLLALLLSRKLIIYKYVKV